MNNNILADFRHNDWNIDKILIFIIPLIFIAILFLMHEEWLLESLLLCTVIFFYILLIYKHRMVYGYSGIRIASIPSSIVAAFTVFISIPSIYILMIKDHPNEIQYYYSIIIFYLIFPMGLYLGKSIRMIDEVKVKKLLISKVAKSYNDKYYYEILIILFSISMLIFCGYLMRVNELPLIELIRNPGGSTRYFYMREEALKLLEMDKSVSLDELFKSGSLHMDGNDQIIEKKKPETIDKNHSPNEPSKDSIDIEKKEPVDIVPEKIDETNNNIDSTDKEEDDNKNNSDSINELDIDEVRQKWKGFIEKVHIKKPSIASILDKSIPLRIENGLIIIQISGVLDFHLNMIENNTEVINDMLGSEFRSNIGFFIEKGSDEPTDNLDENKNMVSENIEKNEQLRDKIVDLFDGEIIT